LEAFIHAGAANETKVNVISIHSEYIDAQNVNEKLAGLDAVVVAPGFGERGIEGKIETVRYVRENIAQLRRYTYGKHIIVRLEKLTNEKF
jgi:CTP synthase